MIELGKTLQNAREAKGYTVTQLADITKLAPSVINHLECENFSDIAAPIYGRGFIRLYCEAVGLDPKPHIAEYMDIVTGTREPVIHERNTARPASAPEAPEPEPQPLPEPKPQPLPEPEPQPLPEPEHAPADDLFGFSANPPPKAPSAPPTASEQAEASFSRYAAPIRHNEGKPPLASFGRLGVLAAAALGLLALAGWGLYALYGLLSTPVGESAETPAPSAVTETAAEPVPKAAAEKSAPRTQQKIPDLFID